MDNVYKIYENFINAVFSVFKYFIKISVNEKISKERIERFRKEPPFPNEIFADILIRRAARKTLVVGAINSLAITALETTFLVPEPFSKFISAGSIISLITSENSLTIKIQLQLVNDIVYLYDCPYDINNDEDLWSMFFLSLGLTSANDLSKTIIVIIKEGAEKQFRKILRTGIRRILQKMILKYMGRLSAKYFAEKYVLRLIPVLNMFIGGYLNYLVTKSVGKWCKVKARIRSSCFSRSDFISSNDRESIIWILPVMYQVGLCENKLTNVFLELYSQTYRHLNLSSDEKSKVDEIIENLRDRLQPGLRILEKENIKESLMQIAIATAAIELKKSKLKKKHECLKETAEALNIEYKEQNLTDWINYFKD